MGIDKLMRPITDDDQSNRENLLWLLQIHEETPSTGPLPMNLAKALGNINTGEENQYHPGKTISLSIIS